MSSKNRRRNKNVLNGLQNRQFYSDAVLAAEETGKDPSAKVLPQLLWTYFAFNLITFLIICLLKN